MLFLVVLAAAASLYISNQLNQEIRPPVFWDETTNKNIKWSARLGSQTYSQPVVSDKYVFIGTNNGARYDPNRNRHGDMGVMICFDKHTGEFLWQHASEKLAVGRSSDWPLQGVTSNAFVDRDRIWFVNNRGEVICLDDDGFRDQKNDGPFVEEATQREIDADVIWKFDMIKQLGVHPHNTSHCNVEVDDDRVYVKTSNGVGPSHSELPAPNAPSFVVLERDTGKLVWHDNAPGRSIMHGSWGSPRLATINGRRQILFPGGDGWLYSYVPEGDGKGNSVLLWKFDCNPKTSEFRLFGFGNGRNNLLAAPTVYQDRIYITMGQDPEHGSGPSRVLCIAPGLKTGDLSATLVKRGHKTESPAVNNQFRHCILENGDKERPNPNSAKVWEYIGEDSNNDGTLDEIEQMGRSLSQVVVANECAFVSTIDGVVHCIDLKTGSKNWISDLRSGIWGTAVVIDDLLFIGTEDGEINILIAEPDINVANPNQIVATISAFNYRAYYSNLLFENGVLYLANRTSLIAVEDPSRKNKVQKWLRK